MQLEKLSVLNFRNYGELQVEFNGRVQCLTGKNGSGKTNLLDAIYYLAFTKSSLNATDTQNIRSGEGLFSIRGTFQKNEKQEEVVCYFQSGLKKMIRENGLDCLKLSDHIGKYPAVMIAPGDIALIWDGGEVRRKFFDSLISQISREYLDHLIRYSSQLKMRNAMLRFFSERGKIDSVLLEACDHQLVIDGKAIATARQDFIKTFILPFVSHYAFLSDEKEELAFIRYQSALAETPFETLLQNNLQKDIALQRTTAGIHRDDFVFQLDGFELKRYGSQGQQKSFLIALKMAEFEQINAAKGFKPILLLDDIFDKLDDVRIDRLIDMIGRDMFGQIFLSDARPDRSKGILAQAGIDAGIFTVESGKLIKS